MHSFNTMVVMYTAWAGGGVVAYIIAQDVSAAPTTVVGALIAGFVGMTGLMVWIVKRMLDTTIPTMQASFEQAQKTFLDALTRQEASRQVSLDRQSETFLTALDKVNQQMAKAQAEYKADLSTLTMSFASEEKELRDLFEKKLAHEREFFAREAGQLMQVFKEDREQMFTVLRNGQISLSTAAAKVAEAVRPQNGGGS